MSCQACDVKDPTPHRDVMVVQGSEFEWNVRVKDRRTDTWIDNTWSANADIRQTLADATVAASFTTAIDNTGVVTLTVDSAVSSGWSWNQGVYDLFLTGPGGDRFKAIHGCIKVAPEVTRV